MEDRLRRHVDSLFGGTAATRNIIDFKEELLQNLREKYADLIREGKSEDESYHIVIAGIGDVTGLIRSLEENEMNNINFETMEKQAVNLYAELFQAHFGVSLLHYILLSAF